MTATRFQLLKAALKAVRTGMTEWDADNINTEFEDSDEQADCAFDAAVDFAVEALEAAGATSEQVTDLSHKIADAYCLKHGIYV